METLNLIDIAGSWSYWQTPPPTSLPRTVDLPDALSDKHALVIQGVRRCGKSTLLQQLVGHYGLDSARCIFLNLEDPRLSLGQSWQTLSSLVEQFRALHPNKAPLYFFLDEIQGVSGWQGWLRAQLDRPCGNIFTITGSNATLLSGKLSSALTGRHLTVELFPFDLRETRRIAPNATLESYLSSGGFPEPLTMTDGDRLRRQYFYDIVERDVRERVRARSSLPVRQVAQMAYESAGAELSLRRVAAATGIAVDTAGAYLEACEAAYLLFSCPYFAFSARKRASRNRKYYPVDTGLRRVVATRGGADRGKALECLTYLTLRRHSADVSYWRGRGEVDFVLRSEGRIVPIQVSWSGTLERHERALEDFYETFPQAEEAIFVTAESFEELVGRLEE